MTSDRIGAYLNAHPDTTAYFDTGFWHAGVARVLADRGVPPGKVLLGGFDLVPEVLAADEGGLRPGADRPAALQQGFLPVMEVYLAKTVGLAPADVDTGQGVVTPDQVDAIMELSAQGRALSRSARPPGEDAVAMTGGRDAQAAPPTRSDLRTVARSIGRTWQGPEDR